MKLKPDISIPAFLRAVRECKAAVYFKTPEGDILNLKSTLSQIVFAVVIGGDHEKIDGSIEVEDSGDGQWLTKYLSA